MIEKTLRFLRGKCSLHAEDVREFANLKAGLLRFHVTRYTLPGIGNLFTL